MTKNLHDVVTSLIPALKVIFELGFLVKESEIVEFSEQLYAARKQYPEAFERPLYTIVPENPNYNDFELPPMLSAGDRKSLIWGIEVLNQYALDHGLDITDDVAVLTHAAKNMPRVISEETAFARPILKVVEKGEKISTKTEEETVLDFIEKFAGKGEELFLRTKDDDGVKKELVISPTVNKKSKKAKEKRLSYEEFGQLAMQRLSEVYQAPAYSIKKEISRKTDEEAYEVIRVWEKLNDPEDSTQAFGSGMRISDFYNEYALGKSVEEAITHMIKFTSASLKQKAPLPVKNLSKFAQTKDKIIIRPLNLKKNAKLLEGNFYRRNGDIALVVYLMLGNHGGQFVSAKLSRAVVAGWGVSISEDELFELAFSNTVKLFKPCVMPAEVSFSGVEIKNYPAVNKYVFEPGFCLEKSANGVYYLFLEDNVNATTAVFCPGLLKALATIVNDDFYVVIPSMSMVAIHEKKSISFSAIKRAVAENAKDNLYARPEEFLTNNVYSYSRRTDLLNMVNDRW